MTASLVRPSCLTQFNYARGYSEGGEFKVNYTNGNFNAHANFAYNITRAIDVESNQYLFDARRLLICKTTITTPTTCSA